MKISKISLCILVSFFLAFSLKAQLKQNTAGKVSIGNYSPSSSYNLYTGTARFYNNVYFESGNLGINTTPSSSYSLDIYAYPPVRFKSPSHLDDIYIHSVNQSMYIYPSRHEACYLGMSTRAFHTVYYKNLSNSSDSRMKENIKDIENALVIISKLRGVKYDLKKEAVSMGDFPASAERKAKEEKERKDNYGFLAQEVNEVYKFAVTYDEQNDIYGIDYTKFTPLLVEAIKDLNEKVTILEKELSKEKSSSELLLGVNSEAYLGQNIPNPFDQETTIDYLIPVDSKKAGLYIYDLQGKQIKSYQIAERNEGSLTISAFELNPGMYHYSLIIDGQVIGTEKMILTD